MHAVASNCCVAITNFLVAELAVLTLLIPKLTTGYGLKIVPSTSDPHNTLPYYQT
jgi:hypothetical protein